MFGEFSGMARKSTPGAHPGKECRSGRGGLQGHFDRYWCPSLSADVEFVKVPSSTRTGRSDMHANWDEATRAPPLEHPPVETVLTYLCHCANMILMGTRTTVRLPESLMREVKRLAAETDRTITKVIEEALREFLARRASAGRRSHAHLPTDGSGGLRPGVDLTDSNSLLDLMDADSVPAGD